MLSRFFIYFILFMAAAIIVHIILRCWFPIEPKPSRSEVIHDQLMGRRNYHDDSNLSDKLKG